MPKKVKYKEMELQALCKEHLCKKKRGFKGKLYYFINLYHFYDETNELDFVYFNEKGLNTEVEIKCALQDLKDDLSMKVRKHELLSARDPSCPNMFMFVAPRGLLPIELIPKYAGLLEFEYSEYLGKHKLYWKRRPPILHRKLTEPQVLFEKVYYQLDKLLAREFLAAKKNLITRLKRYFNAITKGKNTRRKITKNSGRKGK